MDPNSQNQQWSQWTFTVTHTPGRVLPFALVKENAARFFRKGFGSSSRMKIERGRTGRGLVWWEFKVQTEGANANDPDKRAYLQMAVEQFMANGFGPEATVAMEVALLAGAPEDGRPADQWLILPPSIPSTAKAIGPA